MQQTVLIGMGEGESLAISLSLCLQEVTVSIYIYFFLLFQLPLGSPDVIPTSFKLRLLHKKFLQFGCGRSLPDFANVSVTSSSL